MKVEGKTLRKRTYVLPNLLTAGNLFAGFYAIVAAIHGQYDRAAVALIIAGVLDILDGKVARFTGASSRFGIEFDSLADLVSFGVAPAVLIYLWALQPYGRIGWVASFLLVACAALRLARFNVQVGVVERRWFLGLPTPAVSGCIATTVLLLDSPGDPGSLLNTVFVLQAYALAFLMVSTIRYRSFKDFGMERHHFSFLVSTIFIFAIIALNPQVSLFTMAVIYALSGPAEGLYGLLLGRPVRRTSEKRGGNAR